MNFLNKLINLGINNDIQLQESEVIRTRNILFLIYSGILLLFCTIGLIFNEKVIIIINLITFVFFVAIYFILKPGKFSKYKNLTVILIITIHALASYLLVPEFIDIILVFMMLYPIGVTAVFGQRAMIISPVLLVIIVIGNFLNFNPEFIPLSILHLVMYSMAYVAMTISSSLVYKILDRRIHDQKKKVEYYEKEIEQRDEFITRLSHKLRTSLSNITLINNLVHDSRVSSEQKELLDTLKMSTTELISNVNGLVEIATPSIIDYKQSILSFNLAEALQGIADILESDRNLNQKVSIKGAEEIDYHIIGDPSLLRSVLINLTKGIAEEGNIHGELVIEVTVDYATHNMYGLKFSLRFVAKDSAPIVTAVSSMDHRDSKSTHFNLAGRLLSLTQSKAEILDHGNLQIIYFFQDFAKDLTRKIEELLEAGKSGKPQKEKSLQESTLLLVEDNAINQKIVLLSLAKMVKKIDVANNGKEALDMFGTKKYDAILMDIQMPVMDGITATKKIREIEATSDARIPIIAITANALAGDRDNCLAAGADEYLSKPFQVEELIEKLSSCITG